MGEWMQKYNNAERQLDHYRMQASKISRIVPQKIREMEEQVEIAEQKLNVEKKNNSLLKQKMNDQLVTQHEAMDQHDNMTAKLREQITHLRDELTEKNNSILALETENEELKLQKKQDDESVCKKVKLIKDIIRSREIENARLKRLVEQGENDEINQLRTEIERLKEINRVQACNRIAIFEEAYKKFCRDYNLSPPNGTHKPPTFSPIYQKTSSVSSQDPLYTSINQEDHKQTASNQSQQHMNHRSSVSPPHHNKNESPPLPPRRTSASKIVVDERRQKIPGTMCCPQSCYPTKSPYESAVSHDNPSSTGTPPPLSLREAGDGSVSNDYDEIPCDVGDMSHTRMDSEPNHSVRLRTNSSNTLTKTQRVTRKDSSSSSCLTALPPSSLPSSSLPPSSLPPSSLPHFGASSTLPSTPLSATTPSSFHNSSTPQLNGNNTLKREPLSPGCKREPSRSNSMLQSPSKHGKRSWETLIDSLALVGFTDALPNQKCVKSSIGKLPTYTVAEEVSFTDHPYELPPVDEDDGDVQMSPLIQCEPVTEVEKLMEKMKYMGESQIKQVLASPVLSYSGKALTHPLTNLNTPYHVSIGLRINKLLHEFADSPKDLYNTSRTLLTLTSSELINELYTQLLKQTHRQSREILAYWHVLVTVIPFVLPTGRVMGYLKSHLARYSAQKTQAGRFAGYCTRVLQRCLSFGKRKIHPCRLEIEATCGKPYLHSKPMSIPIHLPGGDYHVTGFDTVSSVGEVVRDLETQLGLRTCRWSGCTLFMDDPLNPDVKVPVNHTSKLCDVIAKWEANVKPNNCLIPQVIGLTYQKYLHLSSQQDNNAIPAAEYKLSALQLHDQAMNGIHGMEMELATCLGAVMTQAREGNCPHFSTTKQNNDTLRHLSDFVEKYIPPNIRDRCKDANSKRQLVKDFGEIWSKFRDVPSSELYQKYCTTVERWKYHRSTLFRGLYSHPSDGLKVAVCLNVTETRLTIINAETLVIMDAVELDKITKFGGYPFSITLRINEKNLSIMIVDKHKCYLLTELLASYCRLTHQVSRDGTL